LACLIIKLPVLTILLEKKNLFNGIKYLVMGSSVAKIYYSICFNILILWFSLLLSIRKVAITCYLLIGLLFLILNICAILVSLATAHPKLFKWYSLVLVYQPSSTLFLYITILWRTYPIGTVEVLNLKSFVTVIIHDDCVSLVHATSL
jgi:hypothetical protein